MHENRNGFSIVYILVALAVSAILIAAGFFVVQKQNKSSLSSEDIAKKFDCNRITADVRETDVFCGNPKLYNNPDSLTKEDYYKYLACDERIKNGPPAYTAKTNDPGYYNEYYDCKDETKLESLRQEFIVELKRIKAKNS